MIAPLLNSLYTIRSASAHKKSCSATGSGIAPSLWRSASHASARGSRSSVLGEETPTSVPGKPAKACRQVGKLACLKQFRMTAAEVIVHAAESISGSMKRSSSLGRFMSCRNFRTSGFPTCSWVEKMLRITT